MKIDIAVNGYASLHEIGGRSNNEDHVIPAPNQNEHCTAFVVCDGVGGKEKGEQASRIAAETLFKRFNKSSVFVSDTDVQDGLKDVEESIDNYLADHPSATGMATTMTLVCIHDQGITVSHVGDSRVYHIRDGHVLFHTADHSWVNEMVKSGVLTELEAIDHPRKNVITRAVQGSGKPARPDVALIADIQEADYLFMCTDGILESVSDHVLSGLCSGGNTPDSIIAQIKIICSGTSKDNFSCCLVRIGKVNGAVSQEFAELPYALQYGASVVTEESDSSQDLSCDEATVPADLKSDTAKPEISDNSSFSSTKKKSRINLLKWAVILMVLSVLAGGWALYGLYNGGVDKKDAPTKTSISREQTKLKEDAVEKNTRPSTVEPNSGQNRSASVKPKSDDAKKRQEDAQSSSENTAKIGNQSPSVKNEEKPHSTPTEILDEKINPVPSVTEEPKEAADPNTTDPINNEKAIDEH